MFDQRSHVVQSLVSEEIRRIVADAVGDGMCVSARTSAARILRTYPNCGMGEDEIIDEIVSTASAAGAAVENDPTSEDLKRNGDGTPFGVLFAQAETLYVTLDGMVSGAVGPIDPAQITSKLIEENPSLEFTESELEIAVRKVATVNSRPVTRGEKAKRNSRYSKRRKSNADGSFGLSK